MRFALLCACTLACTSSVATVGDRGPVVQTERPAHVMTSAPSTIEIPLDDATREGLARQLARRSLTVARLSIRELRPQAAQALKGIRVFIEMPTATTRTSINDPHYATSIVLGFDASDSVLLNVAPTLVGLWGSGDLTRAKLDERKSLRVTLVPEPWDGARALPAEFAVTLQGVTLEVPNQ